MITVAHDQSSVSYFISEFHWSRNVLFAFNKQISAGQKSYVVWHTSDVTADIHAKIFKSFSVRIFMAIFVDFFVICSLSSIQNFFKAKCFFSIKFKLSFNSYSQKSALRARARCARMEPPISGVLYWPQGPVPPLGPDLRGPILETSPSLLIIN